MSDKSKLDKAGDAVAKTATRRKVLKSVTLGGGAVTLTQMKWSKPVVDSVTLPAHAQTTEEGGGGGGQKTVDANDLNRGLDYRLDKDEIA